MDSEESRQQLLAERDALRDRLAEANDTLTAIRSGQIDGLVVETPDGPQLFTLIGVDYTYRVLVEQMNEGALTITPAGHILYCNQHFADLVERPLQRVIASSIYDFLAAENILAFEALLTQAHQGQPGRTEVNLAIAVQGHRPAYMSLTPLKLEGEPILCVVVTDLTEQKRNEAIVAAERLARSILDQTSEAIVVCDDSGQIIRANQAAHRLGGQNVLMNPFDKVFSLKAGSGASEISVVEALLRGQIVSRLERSFTTAAGQALSLLVSGGPVLTTEGEQLAYVISLTDITQQKEAEEGLKDQAQKLEAEVARRTRELRQMVNAMSGREVRMAGLKRAVRELRAQLEEAGLTPVADDPLLDDDEVED
ncbi:MAG: PAS domain-containing protein [Anaerolineae bacterium]|nr:PAS domain-containing protein [Anaerolineae bacterium]